jgi:hypothetical protein
MSNDQAAAPDNSKCCTSITKILSLHFIRNEENVSRNKKTIYVCMHAFIYDG